MATVGLLDSVKVCLCDIVLTTALNIKITFPNKKPIPLSSIAQVSVFNPTTLRVSRIGSDVCSFCSFLFL